MKLNIVDRLTCLGVLPQEGDFVTLKIVRDLQSKLGFTEEELKECEIVSDPETQSVKWNEKGAVEKEIVIGEKAMDLIVEALEKLNKDKKLKPQHFSVFEKFVENKDKGE